MSVTYTAVLPERDETVDFLAGLLAAERRRRGTRGDTRSLSCRDQAVLVLRWFLDGTRMVLAGEGRRSHDREPGPGPLADVNATAVVVFDDKDGRAGQATPL